MSRATRLQRLEDKRRQAEPLRLVMTWGDELPPHVTPDSVIVMTWGDEPDEPDEQSRPIAAS